jgi:hypothetical protein
VTAVSSGKIKIKGAQNKSRPNKMPGKSHEKKK